MDIRPARLEDLGPLNDVYNHYVRTSTATFDLDEITMVARRVWFTHYDTTGRYRVFVAVDDGAFAGYACSSQFMERRAYETSVSVSVYVAPDRTGQGVGSGLYRALFDAIAGEDLHRAYAGISLPNAASVAMHESFGFKEVARYTEQGRKFDRYWDVAWFEKPI